MSVCASEMELRTYQVDLVDRFESGKSRALVVLPTGAGKTHVAVAVILRCLDRGGRVLVVAHRRELLAQVTERLVDAGCPAEAIGTSVVVTSMAKVSAVAGPFGLIVIDEAHHAAAKTYRYLLDRFDDVRVMGLTATPSRLDGQPLDMFEEIIEGPPADELIAAGHLAAPRYFGPDAASTRALVDGVRKQAGDYAVGEVSERVNTKALIGNIVAHWQEHAAGMPTITFAASIAHAEAICRRFVAAGVKAKTVTGKTPEKDRDKAIADFRAGRLTMLVNYELFGEGLDVPGVRCVVLARPTASLTVFRQQCGRAMRPGPVTPVILDHAGNVWRHDLPTRGVEWTLDGVVKSPKGGPLVRRCVHCGAMLESFICDDCGECGRRAPPAERVDPEEHEREKLVELARDQAARQTVCAGWEGPCPHGARPSREAFMPRSVHRRKGEPWRCPSCSARRRVTPESRTRLKRVQASMSPDARRNIASAAASAMSLEQRRAAAKKGFATKTSAERSALIKPALDAIASKSAEWRCARAIKINASRRAKKDAAE